MSDISDLALTFYFFTVREPGKVSGHGYLTKEAAERERQKLIDADYDVSEIRVDSLLQ